MKEGLLVTDLEFYNWLLNTKQLSTASAKDVISRCKRIKTILQISSLTDISSEQLIQAEKFKNLSRFVKSQLKRALILWKEFSE